MQLQVAISEVQWSLENENEIKLDKWLTPSHPEMNYTVFTFL